VPVKDITSTNFTNFLIQNTEFILNLLAQKGNSESAHEAIHLLSRFKDLEKIEDKGTATQADLNVLKSQLTEAFLKIVT
jgi:hypothetical protein